jgi:hypothetical protein
VEAAQLGGGRIAAPSSTRAPPRIELSATIRLPGRGHLGVPGPRQQVKELPCADET